MALVVLAAVPPSALAIAYGVNSADSVGDFLLARHNGLSLTRYEMDSASSVASIDQGVALRAAAGLRVYGLISIYPPTGTEAGDIQRFVAQAQWAVGRYGPDGSFWAENPGLPYLPATSWEVGNEPNMPLAPGMPDGLYGRYTSPAEYAAIYAAVRAAIHQLQPSAVVVVGGLAITPSVTTAQQYLSALYGPVDAVGIHPYLYQLAPMMAATAHIRDWLDHHGHARTPIDVNEFGAWKGTPGWPITVTHYVRWLADTPSLLVRNAQPYWWGDVAYAASSDWQSLVDSSGQVTAFGRAFFCAVRGGSCPANLSLTKSAPATASVDKPFSYTVTVSNGGPGYSTGTTVLDQLPAGETLYATTPSQGTCTNSGSPANVTCSLGVIASGSSVTVTMTVTESSAGNVTNTATVTNDQGSNASGSASTQVVTFEIPYPVITGVKGAVAHRGKLLLDSTRLAVHNGFVSVPFTCIGSLPCDGNFSIDHRVFLAGTKALAPIVCTRSRSTFFRIAGGHHKTVKVPVTEGCLALLEKASNHTLRGKLTSKPRTGQEGIIKIVHLFLR